MSDAPSRRRTPTLVAVLAAVLATAVGLGVALVPDDGPATDGPASVAASGSAQQVEEAEEGRTRRAPRSLGIGTGWGPSANDIRRAERLVRAMSLPDLAGQVIVSSYAGTGAPTRVVDDLNLGGVIIFDRNVGSSSSLRSELRSMKRAVDRPWPLWISADQEGGLVERLQDDLTRFPTFMSAGAADKPAVVRAASRGSGRELAWLGVNADFAPVADVTAGPGDPTIGSRSASEFAKRAADAVTAAGRGFSDAGVVPVLKHFPGHGAAPADSHLTLPVLDRPMKGLRDIDFVPFEAAFDDGLPAVMVGHLDVAAIDPGRPSSLSKPIVTGLLRERLGFEGLVVSDALDMAAITSQAGSTRPVVRALRAGVDLLVMPPDPRLARDGIVNAVRSGALPLRRLQQAAARQGALMLHAQRVRRGEDAVRPGRPGTARGASWRLSRAAVTQVAGTCGVRNVGESVSITGPADDVATLASAFRTYGIEVVSAPSPAAPEGDDDGADDAAEAGTESLPAPSTVSGVADTRVAVTGFRGGPVTGDVVVSTDSPWSLGASSGAVKIASFGDTTGAMRAVVQVLLGRRAPGTLPVRVDGVDKGCPAR